MILGHEKPPLDEALLAHHGVKGMKWGVHKKEETSGSSSSSNDYQSIKPKKPTPAQARKSIRKREETFLQKTAPSEAGGSGKKGLSPGQKKMLLIGAGALAAAAVIGGAAYAHKKGYLGDNWKSNVRSGEKALTENGKRYLSDLDKAKLKSWESLDSFIQPSSYERKEFSLPAGHTFHRISHAREASFATATYATHSTEDYNRYLGNGFGQMISFGEKLHHVTWTSKEEVKVPNLQTVLDTLKDVMAKDNPQTTAEEVLRKYTGMTGGSWESPEAKNLFRALKSKGYGALVDEMDAGVHSDSPLVVFASEIMNRKQSSIDSLSMKEFLNARKSLTPLKRPKL